MDLATQVCRHPDDAWVTYNSPKGATGNAVSLAGSNKKTLVGIGDKGPEMAAIAFSFSMSPNNIKTVKDGGVASWEITLAAGEVISLGYTSSIEQTAQAAIERATQWADGFDEHFNLAKTQWEEIWEDAFTPGNKFIA